MEKQLNLEITDASTNPYHYANGRRGESVLERRLIIKFDINIYF